MTQDEVQPTECVGNTDILIDDVLDYISAVMEPKVIMFLRFLVLYDIQDCHSPYK